MFGEKLVEKHENLCSHDCLIQVGLTRQNFFCNFIITLDMNFQTLGADFTPLYFIFGLIGTVSFFLWLPKKLCTPCSITNTHIYSDFRDNNIKIPTTERVYNVSKFFIQLHNIWLHTHFHFLVGFKGAYHIQTLVDR